MAGIGFELRHMSRSESYWGLLRAYAYAGAIGSGPWVLSILAVLILGFLSIGVVIPPRLINQFQVTVTWLIACSLIYTGSAQLGYTRYIADRLFQREQKSVVPTLNALLLVILAPGFGLGIAAIWLLVPDTSLSYRLILLTTFLVLSAVWLLTVLLSGLKRYRGLLLLYALGYGSALGLGLSLRFLDLNGLLLGFLLGQFLLLTGMMMLVWREYPSIRLFDFDFLGRRHIRPWLLAAGMFFNLGVWADKFLFWLWPPTSRAIIGHLRASIIYDTPIFLAYFTIIPGMAVFLLRMETDFAHAYERYYEAVRSGGALSTLRDYRVEMVRAARKGLYDIIKVQGVTLFFVIALGPRLLKVFGLTSLYAPLLNIDSIGVALQVLLMAALNILFYLDRLRAAALITILLFVSNFALSALTLYLGPFYFGYGFAGAMLIAALAALAVTDRVLDRLNYETFMLH